MATEVWKGIFKLIEEAGEVTQAAGKLCVYTSGEHPDGKDWRNQMMEELADLEAVIIYFRAKNYTEEEQRQMLGRTLRKLDKFNEWGLFGVKD